MKKKILLFLFVMQLLSIFGFNQDTQEYEDTQVMSNVLLNICKFTTWPHEQDSNKPFIITVLGRSSEEEELYFSRGLEMKKRKILVHKIRKMEDFKGSDVLFITISEQSHLKNILSLIENKPVLTATLCESVGMAQKGVMINLFLSKKDNVAFIINLNALRKASLELSTTVLKLARKVIDSERDSNNNEIHR